MARRWTSVTFATLLIATLLSTIFVAPAAAASERVVPKPSECVVEPRTVEEIVALSNPTTEASPVVEGSPVATPAIAEEAVSAEVEQAIRAAALQLVACINAGDQLRLYGLFSDNLLLYNQFDPAELATPKPLAPENWYALVDVVYINRYPDGRVGAVILFDDPTAPSPVEAFFFYFVQEGDQWLLDEFPSTISGG
jgi:hypothetical protein